jgi:hypothetical protein
MHCGDSLREYGENIIYPGPRARSRLHTSQATLNCRCNAQVCNLILESYDWYSILPEPCCFQDGVALLMLDTVKGSENFAADQAMYYTK